MPAKTSNETTLLPETEELARGKNFAAVSTVLPSGLIQTQTIWVDVLDGQIVLNTELHRAKHKNIERDPRVTVLIRDEENPYRYAEVRGTVTATVTGAEARTQIDQLAQKYGGSDYPDEAIKSERVLWRITPQRQTFIDQAKGIAGE